MSRLRYYARGPVRARRVCVADLAGLLVQATSCSRSSTSEVAAGVRTSSRSRPRHQQPHNKVTTFSKSKSRRVKPMTAFSPRRVAMFDSRHLEPSVIIAFRTLTLRRLCEDNSVAVAKFGEQIGAGLRGRVADLRAAGTIADLVVGTPRTGGPTNRELTLDLAIGASTLWIANHTKPRVDDAGMVDWSRTTYVQLIEIEVI